MKDILSGQGFLTGLGDKNAFAETMVFSYELILLKLKCTMVSRAYGENAPKDKGKPAAC